MNRISFLLFSLLGCLCIALLQLGDILSAERTMASLIVEWASIDLIWLALLIFAIHQYCDYSAKNG
ncbi:hypothetical protein L4D09_03200 [Photobacterium makurazakiensis]|uniref:hypothetical protein n=1 Tax=Photobacterium makurazakiensis TaxID=2910234 RepID=UPI003D0BE384